MNNRDASNGAGPNDHCRLSQKLNILTHFSYISVASKETKKKERERNKIERTKLIYFVAEMVDGGNNG